MRPAPKISVVTVNFNDGRGLERTLRSTASQTYPFRQHVVIDGGSTDGSPQILAAWNAPGGEFHYVSEPDKGIYDAMNKGIARASGDVVVFMNAGDTFFADSDLEFVAKQWQTSRWEWGYGSSQYVTSDGEDRFIYAHDPFSIRHFRLGLRWIPHQSTYFSSALLGTLGGYREIAGSAGDAELEMRAALEELPVVWDRPLSRFYSGGAHENNSTLARELQWSTIRRVNGVPVMGSVAPDLVWVALMTGYRQARKVAGRIRHRGRRRG